MNLVWCYFRCRLKPEMKSCDTYSSRTDNTSSGKKRSCSFLKYAKGGPLSIGLRRHIVNTLHHFFGCTRALIGYGQNHPSRGTSTLPSFQLGASLDCGRYKW